MSIDRVQMAMTLSACDPQALEAGLRVLGQEPTEDEGSLARAEQLVRALWWSASTPAGYAMDRSSLGDLVEQIEKRLELPRRRDLEDWDRLEQLRQSLVERLGAAPEEQLDALLGRELRRSWSWSFVLATLGASSWGLGWVGRRVGAWLAASTAIRWIALFPNARPYLSSLLLASSLAGGVGTPAALGLGLLSLHQALGPKPRTLCAGLLVVASLKASSLPQRS